MSSPEVKKVWFVVQTLLPGLLNTTPHCGVVFSKSAYQM